MSKAKKDVGAIVHKGRVSFRVWAPFARAVDVTGVFNDWGRSSLLSEGDGYWAASVPGALPGQEYMYVIHTATGEIVRHDPRALHLTTNKGNSVLVDTHFEWTDQNFAMKPLNEQIVYEVHVGTFYRPDSSVSGTFEDVAAKLDYLVDLGVTAIQLMPIASMSDDRGWGYTPDFIYAVESLYGGRHALMKFVDDAHSKGVAVLLDVVYNHIGPTDNDLWQFDGWSENNKGGIYFYNDWRSKTPWGETRPDYGRPEVRQFILDNVKMWLRDCHIDGLRFDSTGYMRNVYGNNEDPANDIPEAWHLLQEAAELGHKIRPSALMIAEDFGANDFITKGQPEGGAGFDAQWEVGFPVVLRNVLDKDSDPHLGELLGILEHGYNGAAFQRLIYSDSHDSAANGGARFSEEVSPGDADSLYSQRRSLTAAALVLTAPGVPMLFQGQEFLEGGSFNDWRALEWERSEKLAGIVLAHQHLIALRRNVYGNTRGLTGQSFAVLHLNEENKVLAYHRWDQGGAGDDVVVVFNLSNRTQKDYFVNFPRKGDWQVRFNSDWKGYSAEFKDTPLSAVTVQNDGGHITIPPYSVLILSQN